MSARHFILSIESYFFKTFPVLGNIVFNWIIFLDKKKWHKLMIRETFGWYENQEVMNTYENVGPKRVWENALNKSLWKVRNNIDIGQSLCTKLYMDSQKMRYEISENKCVHGFLQPSCISTPYNVGSVLRRLFRTVGDSITTEEAVQ